MAIATRALVWTPHGGSPLDIQASDLGIYLQIVMGLDEVPGVRGLDMTVPGLSGRLMTNRVADLLALELAGSVMGVGTTESGIGTSYRDIVTSLQAAFDPTLYGVLDITLEDSSTRSVTARPLNLVWGPENGIFMRDLSIALEQVTGLEAAGS